MGTPKRQEVIDDLYEALEALAGNPGALSAPCTVERTIKEWASTGQNERPWVGMRPARETISYQPFGIIDAKLLVDIVGHVTADSDLDRSQRLNDLMDTIIAGISLDPQRGCKAIDTKVLQTETDEGDPDTVDSRGGGGTLAMVVEIHYQRTVDAS